MVEFSEINSVTVSFSSVNCSFKGKLIYDIVHDQFYGILDFLFLIDFVYLTQDCISISKVDRGFDGHPLIVLRDTPRDNHINGSDKPRILPTFC